MSVQRGQIYLDPSASTAWVNDDDWIALEGSRSGIATILGGADNDDALNLVPFTDYDRTNSKSSPGVRPTNWANTCCSQPDPRSTPIEWQTPTKTIRYPPMDSRKLPPRIDTTSTTYLGLVKPSQAQPTSDEYSLNSMFITIQQARTNEGALGMYCNLLMLCQALYGRQPKQPADRLEAVIDAMVKTGDDLTLIKEYCTSSSMAIINSGIAIPRSLLRRLSIPRDQDRKAIYHSHQQNHRSLDRPADGWHPAAHRPTQSTNQTTDPASHATGCDLHLRHRP